MYSHDIMLATRNTQQQKDVMNVVSIILKEQFKKFNWNVKKMNSCDDSIMYENGNKRDFFEYKMGDQKIYINVPMDNCQYVTHFTDYFQACEYIKLHLNIFETKNRSF